MQVSEPAFKQVVSLRIDSEALAWYRRKFNRYQTMMNAVLVAYMREEIAKEAHGIDRDGGEITQL